MKKFLPSVTTCFVGLAAAEATVAYQQHSIAFFLLATLSLILADFFKPISL